MKLIESKFPLVEINAFSEYEMSFKLTPKRITELLRKITGISDARAAPEIKVKIHSLFYYPARIPASATRPVSLASILNDNTEISDLLNACGLVNLKTYASRTKKFPTLFMVDPDRDLVRKLAGGDPSSIVVVDPMSGGGSIPLEAKRLGFTVIAGDYNPVSYLLLRATIEFPAKYGKRLYDLVNEEAKKLINYVRSELGKYYPQDGKNIVFVPAIEHDCGAVISLIRETALYKGEKKSIYASWSVSEVKKIQFKLSESPPPPLDICPFCRKPISVELLRRRWIQKHKELIDRLLQGDESAADEVMKLYQLVVIQISRSNFRTPIEQDEAMLVEAARELAKVAKQENMVEYLPMYPIPEDNEVFKDVRETGLDFWHYLYTPRQLLVMYKVIKYIKERAQELKRVYGELGVAAALYLVLGFAKALNFNSILTQWNATKGAIRDLVGSHYALSRRVSLGYDFAEGNLPIFGLEWAFEAEEEELGEEEAETTAGGMLPVLKLLCESLKGLWYESKDGIYLWDARRLNEYLPPASIDLVNIDPPYYDQHNYAGITEFFWVVALTALRDVIEDLFPRERVKINWDPYSPEVPKDAEMRGEPPKTVGGASKFGEDFTKFLKAVAGVLKPDGLLVVWYAYGKLSGWEELFYRFYEAGYAVTKTWQVWTQSSQRRVALHTKAFFTSIVIVARPNARRQPILSADDPRLAEEVSRRVRESLQFILSTYGVEHLHEALVVSMADGIAGITLFEMPSANPLAYVSNFRNMLNKALEVATSTILRELMRLSYPKLPEISLDNVSRLYLMLLLVAQGERGGQLRVSHDFVNRLSQVLHALITAVTVQRVDRSEADTLVSPEDMANRSYNISESLRLLYNVAERVSRGEIRSAEEYAKEQSRHAPLALVIASLAWDKIGVSNVDKESVLNVLRKVI